MERVETCGFWGREQAVKTPEFFLMTAGSFHMAECFNCQCVSLDAIMNAPALRPEPPQYVGACDMYRSESDLSKRKPASENSPGLVATVLIVPSTMHPYLAPKLRSILLTFRICHFATHEVSAQSPRSTSPLPGKWTLPRGPCARKAP